MSALGQKQTYAAQQVMSALLPIATAKADICASSCPLYPQKQACAVHLPMSALGQKRTSEDYKTKEGETDPEAFDGLVRINQRARLWGRSHASNRLSCAPSDFGALSENASGLFVLESKCTSIPPS